MLTHFPRLTSRFGGSCAKMHEKMPISAPEKYKIIIKIMFLFEIQFCLCLEICQPGTGGVTGFRGETGFSEKRLYFGSFGVQFRLENLRIGVMCGICLPLSDGRNHFIHFEAALTRFRFA